METAGYVLLTQVILGRTGYAGPIVTYLTNQRQGGVGFVSTQVWNYCHKNSLDNLILKCYWRPLHYGNLENLEKKYFF